MMPSAQQSPPQQVSPLYPNTATNNIVNDDAMSESSAIQQQQPAAAIPFNAEENVDVIAPSSSNAPCAQPCQQKCQLECVEMNTQNRCQPKCESECHQTCSSANTQQQQQQILPCAINSSGSTCKCNSGYSQCGTNQCCRM
ncbi:unnamed protein product [Anisakis simplex]|uniref:Uncharacterized protein n=1 Tax=Anisakis simplex TaxID=6269 RepID=A0A0M3JHY2_ANISI|nr:unnamed protein product [Anisakis simplex]